MGLSLLTDEMHSFNAAAAAATVAATATADTPDVAGAAAAALSANIASWVSLTQEVQANTRAAVDVLDDLLNYDKIEMGTLVLDFSVVCAWDLVHQSTQSFQLAARQESISLAVQYLGEGGSAGTLEACPRHLVVVGDSSRISQVMRNLISNALKFTDRGGRVTVSGACNL
jgi:signal transduction histidine kinase